MDAAEARGLAAQAAQPVQYRPDGYGPYGDRNYQREQYRPDGYRPDPYRPEDQEGRFGRDPRDGYGQDRRRPDDRGDRGGAYGGGGGPGGSYRQSCDDIRQQGSTLTAVCRDGRGRRVETSIDTARCGRSDIGNNGGVLQCAGTRGNGRRVD